VTRSAPDLFAAAGVLLVLVGLLGFVLRRRLVQRVLALNVLSSGVFVLFVALARRGPGPDAVPHAMVLTGIVVAVSATALALALARRVAAETGREDLPDADGEDGA
jgi:multicomponent Na+:H+ antiporter subunit C